ncbi:TPA: hypothetical protein N0F65_006471 [Lagenidium giganteum]|uniref:Fe2OG dioxygenase domain-containing protein n=1 Tax=Lagenidium giganteum TaxID=4803 RepID=A0AAV2YAU7_9STRA|nr:TPA: hypothetical protein N0F65_006471 [Lagenidium giganteum]
MGASVLYVKDPEAFMQSVHTSKQRVLATVNQRIGSNGATSVPGVDCKQAEQYLTTVHPVKGFHVLCVAKTPSDTLAVTAYKDGMLPARFTETAMDSMSYLKQLEKVLEVPEPKDSLAKKYKQPYALFTPDGQRVEKLSEMVNQILFFFEGGQFIWPGIKIGHKTLVKNVYGRGDVVLETVSMIPLVFTVEEFLKDDEIDVILDLSMEHLKPSGVTLMDGHENRPATEWRTSTTYFLPSTRHIKVQEIDRRTADLVKVPVSHQEFVQVLRYEKTQKYDQHTDYFPPEFHQNQPDVLESIDHGYKNRMITVFWYMSDVAKGGHTIFPRFGGKPQPNVMNDCTKGLKVPPKKRKVVVFYSMLPNGELDPMSLHGGCPVEEGVKYSGNKWVWNKPRKDIS